MQHPPDVAHKFALQIGRVTNRLLHSEMEYLNWQTSSSFELGVEYINNFDTVTKCYETLFSSFSPKSRHISRFIHRTRM